MSLPDPNAAAPATDQPAEVIATTDEIEKKRIELKSMLSGCIASGKLQKCCILEKSQKIWSNLAKIQQNSGKNCEILEKNSKKFSNF